MHMLGGEIEERAERSHLQAQEKGLRRKQTSKNLDLGLLTSRL